MRVLSPPAVDELKVAVVPSQGEGHAQHSIARQYEIKQALSRIGTGQDGRERGGRRMNYRLSSMNSRKHDKTIGTDGRTRSHTHIHG